MYLWQQKRQHTTGSTDHQQDNAADHHRKTIFYRIIRFFPLHCHRFKIGHFRFQLRFFLFQFCKTLLLFFHFRYFFFRRNLVFKLITKFLQAVSGPRAAGHQLGIKRSEPCLVMMRRTVSESSTTSTSGAGRTGSSGAVPRGSASGTCISCCASAP